MTKLHDRATHNTLAHEADARDRMRIEAIDKMLREGTMSRHKRKPLLQRWRQKLCRRSTKQHNDFTDTTFDPLPHQHRTTKQTTRLLNCLCIVCIACVSVLIVLQHYA